jgi:hypothetical protein
LHGWKSGDDAAKLQKSLSFESTGPH